MTKTKHTPGLEANLPENLDARALHWTQALRSYNEAEECLNNAATHLVLANGRRHSTPAAESTILAIEIARKCIVADRIGIQRNVDFLSKHADAMLSARTALQKAGGGE